ncbi:MAG: NAD(P)/FAD-dependent oxidoreductase, partial [Geminicoccaceae bacterium]
MTERVDVLIAGAGIAGTSLAFELADIASVLLLERESQPGYHSTGRSAAMLTETYGSASVRALAGASRSFLAAPPEGFCETPLLCPRGMLHIARADQHAALEAAYRAAAALVPSVRRLRAAEIVEQVPAIDPAYAGGGLLEPDAMAIDVAALHQGYLRGFRRRGGGLVSDAEIVAIESQHDGWRVETRAGSFAGGVLVNAAGAWADQLARIAGVAPVGLVAKRRTALLLDPPDGIDPVSWPMVIDVEEQFYFKPEAGQLLLSPGDETPVAPCDVQPEELDVAIAIERYREVTGRPVRRIGRRWAGLRSFVADPDPVGGDAPNAPGFFWLAGQGG